MARPALLWLVLAAGCALAACSSRHAPPDAACVQGTRAVDAALRHAPGAVTLAGGATLADCVSASRDPSDLQNVGSVFTSAASDLEEAAPRDPRAAMRLGYLVGAVERGADRTGGLQDELVNRMLSSLDAAHLKGATRAAAMRGRAAGRSRG
jgi:hypothetical protein